MQSIAPEIRNVTENRHNETTFSSKRSLRDAAPDVRASGRAGGCSVGLVHSQTSDTLPPSPARKAQRRPDAIVVSPSENRLKRLKSSVLTAARLHAQSKPKWRVVMITPTYSPENSWSAADITNLVKCIRQWLGRRQVEMRYVWVLEYTRKGKPHYHMLVWLPLGITLPFPDKRGWWTKGWTNSEWARNAVGYIAKYASKGSDLVQYTRNARHHGNGGMTGAALIEQRWWKRPGWLREITPPEQPIRRNRTGCGGGWVDLDTGQVFESPWEVVFERGVVFIQLKGQA